MFRLIITAIFWLQWTLVTSLSLALLLPMWKSIGFWSLLVYWFVLGFSQALVLWQRLPRAFASWLTITSFVGVSLWILLVLFVILFFCVALIFVGPAPFSSEVLEALYLVFTQTWQCLPLLAAVGGLLLSWAQYRVLRQQDIRLSGWWGLTSLVSWLVGSIVLLIFLFSFMKPLSRLNTDSALSMADVTFRRMLLSLAGVGAIGGATKGGVLAWLLHRARR